jgi:2-keto-4-pentenoate hydratase/2-oxohepta-3-ene-1,7-dioic acid hydratase in catechol pathway
VAAFRYAERVKLATFAILGKVSYGAVVGDGIVDLRPHLGESRYPTLKSVLAARALDAARAAAERERPDHRLLDVELRPVIPDATKILCVGLNYHAHRDETGHRDPTAHPALFIRYADTQVGHGQPLVLPRNAKDFDYEGELAVVIGKRARHVPASRALEYVAGYSCYHDGSLRDWQFHTSQWTPGKNFPGTAGFGPWLVTTDELSDPSKLTLVTRLNGKEMQRAPTDLMIFDVPTIIEYVTGFTELLPGDVIATGTPGGVGFKREPPVFMKAGDAAEVEISGIGVLRNPVVAEKD